VNGAESSQFKKLFVRAKQLAMSHNGNTIACHLVISQNAQRGLLDTAFSSTFCKKISFPRI